MSSSALGRVRGNIIELDASLPALEGKRVSVVIEPVEEPDARIAVAIANAPLDDQPLTDEERRCLAEYRAGRTSSVTSDEMRAKIQARVRDGR